MKEDSVRAIFQSSMIEGFLVSRAKTCKCARKYVRWVNQLYR